MAAAARSPWMAPWDTAHDHPECYLLDLACAVECSRADAVGRAQEADYVFTRRSSLTRRDLLMPDAPAMGCLGPPRAENAGVLA